ncbi:DUF4491 family protein [Tissierella pigra]|uniref:DUF4491 family protein n=1 Tax=Tissierella pigra TaxID=2607614 RepID=A0A6N7XI43_9FIRM|nr:DUF4491 family protein [Tissierella pigra]MBU5425083.1 DUF4491 family protein [Tissierella pigra]MSU01699.1 DUF4491 family protein [Tissierella pigra]
MSFDGVIIGVGAFLIIGILHPVVIKTEYYIGVKAWPLFLIGGLVFICFSLFSENTIISSLLAVLGFSLLWSIHEIFEQVKRVEKGWFPSNPKKIK